MKDLIDDIGGFVDKAKAAKEKYDPAIKVGLDALDTAKSLFEKMQAGDEEGVKAALTKWDDVNKTLEAIHKMDKAIEDAENGVELMDVLEVVGKVVRIVVTLAALA